MIRVANNDAMVIVSSLVEDVLIVVPYTIPLLWDHLVGLDGGSLFLELNHLWQLSVNPPDSLDCFSEKEHW